MVWLKGRAQTERRDLVWTPERQSHPTFHRSAAMQVKNAALCWESRVVVCTGRYESQTRRTGGSRAVSHGQEVRRQLPGGVCDDDC